MKEEVDIGDSLPEDVVEPIPITGLRFWLIMVGLSLSLFIASMDMTVVATALTRIAIDLDGANNIGLVASAYIITSTALQPLYGKFSDIFGRQTMIILALTLFTLGSIGCGSAISINMLIGFRALAGLGGGGLISMTTIIISDLVPLHKRSSYMGVIGANFALASIFGPLIGGLLTDTLSWRWAFYINLPFSFMSIFGFIFLLKLPQSNRQTLRQKINRVDFFGSLTLVSWITLLILGLNWGGNVYAWSSLPVILTLSGAAVLIIIFIFIELRFAEEPIIPAHIFTRNVTACCAISFLIGGVMFPTIIYTPIFFQVSKGESAILSGLELMPVLMGIVVASSVSGIVISRTGAYLPVLYLGCLLSLTGSFMMSYLVKADIEAWQSIVSLLILGVGFGCILQTVIIASQAAAEPKDTAVVTSLIAFSRSLGGVIGLAMLGCIFYNVITTQLTRYLPGDVSGDGTSLSMTLNPATISDPNLARVIKLVYARAYRIIYFAASFYLALAGLSASALVNLPLRK